jgi:uncharacterized protein
MFAHPLFPYVATPVLLVFSNIFMTLAWYGHLKFKAAPLIEYCLAVPANRIGHAVYSTAQLKTIQEVITLAVFVVFSVTYMKESLTPGQLLGFGFIALGAGLIFFKPL